MEIINLDKFVTDFAITLNGKKYIVNKIMYGNNCK